MSRTIVVTGAASGIGRATAEELMRSGHRVIGVDLADADVSADLSSAQGRASMVESVTARAPDGIDGVVAAAGVTVPTAPERILAVNYFGAVASLELLRPHLLRSASPCAVAVISTACLLGFDAGVVDACLSGDEAGALAMAGAAETEPGVAYCTSKNALARWLRSAAIARDWAGSGILLNGVAPGSVRTRMIEPYVFTEEGREMLAKTTPVALADRTYGEPEELAEVIAFLVTMRGRYLLGQIVYTDGGTEAILRNGTI